VLGLFVYSAMETIGCLVLQRFASVYQATSKEAGRKLFVEIFFYLSKDWRISITKHAGFTENLQQLESQLCHMFVNLLANLDLLY